MKYHSLKKDLKEKIETDRWCLEKEHKGKKYLTYKQKYFSSIKLLKRKYL